MFLVTMTLAVLASVGLYALAATTSEVTASGSERQATQTHYLAQYGVLGASHELAASKAKAIEFCNTASMALSIAITTRMGKAIAAGRTAYKRRAANTVR